MIKYKHGVTVVSVLVIIVVLSVLSGILVVSTKSILNYTYRKEFNNEYYLVKSAVSDYITRNSGVIDFEETNINLNSIKKEYLNQFESENVQNNIIQAYVVDLDKIGVYNTTYGNAQDGDTLDRYVVTKDTHMVYYKKGFNDNDYVYYKAVND